MRKRRWVVAYAMVEDPKLTTFRHAAANMTIDEILAEGRRPLAITLDYDGEPQVPYWCAADKPNGIDVKPVYNRSEIIGEGRCEECHIPIRELQEMMT